MLTDNVNNQRTWHAYVDAADIHHFCSPIHKRFNPAVIAEFFIFYQLEILPPYRDSQLQVGEQYSYLSNMKLIIYNSY